MEALTYPLRGKQGAAFNVISDLPTALIPLDSKTHMAGQTIRNFS
jgi:hypothetical protein